MSTTTPTKRKRSEDEICSRITDKTEALLKDLGRANDILFDARKRLKKIYTMAGKVNMPCIIEDAQDEEEWDENGIVTYKGHFDDDECPHNIESMVKEMEEILIPKLKKRIAFCVAKWP